MKKFFTLIACALMTLGASAETVIYSWESPDGTVVETGGTATYVEGDQSTNRVNYPNSIYYTISLNGKKANIGDSDGTAACGRIVVSLNEGLQENDKITITAYRNKNADGKTGSIYMLLEKGTEFAGAEGSLYWVNILKDESNNDYDNDGDKPNSYTWTVPAAEEGSKTITMTRNDAGTNVFIVKMVITREGGTGIKNVTTTSTSSRKYMENGQIVISNNGKKFNAVGAMLK